MPDPTSVTHAQVRAAYDALGLDGEIYDRLGRFEISVTPRRLDVMRRYTSVGDGPLVTITEQFELDIRLDVPEGATDD